MRKGPLGRLRHHLRGFPASRIGSRWRNIVDWCRGGLRIRQRMASQFVSVYEALSSILEARCQFQADWSE
jgi:hypothetical protein